MSIRSFFLFTSLSDSDFEPSNISVKENKLEGVDLNSDGLDYSVGKKEGKILRFWQTEFQFQARLLALCPSSSMLELPRGPV